MSDMHLVQKLPPMLTGNELTQALAVLPEYDPDILNQNDARRLMALTDLYRVYVPNQMTKEIYSKLYLALLRSLQKKEGSLRVKQSLENYKAIQRQQFSAALVTRHVKAGPCAHGSQCGDQRSFLGYIMHIIVLDI